MDPASLLPLVLGLATLLPLVSFLILLAAGSRLRGGWGGYLASSAIVGAALLSLFALLVWCADEAPGAGREQARGTHHQSGGAGSHGQRHGTEPPPYYAGDYYTLGQFGKLRLTIGYHIDALTICMFCMVSLIASCIHFYSWGYMHEELGEVTDHEVTLQNGACLRRRGRYHVFFQYMSLFSFSMLGLVLAGNVAMVFVFWELVGICSYFLIGFYVERRSACLAANKAFIVNRVGDFGMIVGMMALWSSLGTFTFGDIDANGDGVIANTEEAVEVGVFSQVRPRHQEQPYALRTPDGMVRLGARGEVAAMTRASVAEGVPLEAIEAKIAAKIPGWREPEQDGQGPGRGYWLLIVAGAGIFCGCVGKSAQFPLHVWLPDAMEGPTPVSALVHSATMVAAGVYLVGRFFPVFAPEVLLAIAVTGCITLFMAATIAITATDIKRVLAYSTVSQLGYMMLALGVAGWLAGMLHLITHAFFKSLLFLCSGSVIHAVHSNEMTVMGGLRRKMPITASAMLIGCLAISGAGVPFVVGLSGYYSKDAILEQAYALMIAEGQPAWAGVFFWVAASGAAITAFYMFRLWYMTFAGTPRDEQRYQHAHESPRTMWIPLVILAGFAAFAVFPSFRMSPLVHLLQSAEPLGAGVETSGKLVHLTWPSEHANHASENFARIAAPVTLLAFGTGLGGFVLATLFYGVKRLDPNEVRQQFAAIYRFLRNKWWFDELYDWVFVRPLLTIACAAAAFDKVCIDGFLDGAARATRWAADAWDRLVDHALVDGSVNLLARGVHGLGLRLRGFQTGSIRQYVMFIVMGVIAIFLLIRLFLGASLAS